MKYNLYIWLLLGLLYQACDVSTDNDNTRTIVKNKIQQAALIKKTKCDSAKNQAREDFNNDIYKQITFGYTYPDTILSIYSRILFERYNILYDNGGCSPDEEDLCYSKEMNHLVHQKFSKVFISTLNDAFLLANHQMQGDIYEYLFIQDMPVPLDKYWDNNLNQKMNEDVKLYTDSNTHLLFEVISFVIDENGKYLQHSIQIECYDYATEKAEALQEEKDGIIIQSYTYDICDPVLLEKIKASLNKRLTQTKWQAGKYKNKPVKVRLKFEGHLKNQSIYFRF